MNNPDAAEVDRAAIMRTTAELLAAVNASDVDRCLAVWAADGVLMPPHHPSVQGHEAIGRYFRTLFLRSRFSFAFTSSDIRHAGDSALERVTYTVIVWPGSDASPIEDLGKGLHVYGRRPNGWWKLTHEIWNSDRSVL
jgi:ketosteroid isomerase-like protein